MVPIIYEGTATLDELKKMVLSQSNSDCTLPAVLLYTTSTGTEIWKTFSGMIPTVAIYTA
jgi:hypothetical protein